MLLPQSGQKFASVGISLPQFLQYIISLRYYNKTTIIVCQGEWRKGTRRRLLYILIKCYYKITFNGQDYYSPHGFKYTFIFSEAVFDRIMQIGAVNDDAVSFQSRDGLCVWESEPFTPARLNDRMLRTQTSDE